MKNIILLFSVIFLLLSCNSEKNNTTIPQKTTLYLGIVIFLIGFILTFINAFLYQFFKAKSHKYN